MQYQLKLVPCYFGSRGEFVGCSGFAVHSCIYESHKQEETRVCITVYNPKPYTLNPKPLYTHFYTNA